jgi:hypothetical protein
MHKKSNWLDSGTATPVLLTSCCGVLHEYLVVIARIKLRDCVMQSVDDPKPSHSMAFCWLARPSETNCNDRLFTIIAPPV